MITIQKSATNSKMQEFSMAHLLALLQQATKVSTGEIARQFDDVHRLLEALPLTSALYCFAHNWLASAQKLCETGDLATAHYQVSAVARKLNLSSPEILGPTHLIRKTMTSLWSRNHDATRSVATGRVLWP